MIEALRLSSNDGPHGFADWLEKHIEQHDPIARYASPRFFRDDSALSTATSPTRPRSGSLSSHRCWNERCIYYIYGFPNQVDRDVHARSHSGHYSKRDSGLSLGNTPPLPPQKNLPALPSAETVRQAPPVKSSRPGGPPNLPPLSLQIQPRDRRESLAFSIPSSRPATSRGSMESENESLLPPLKRNRVGHSRLQSIGELQLLRDNDPCLRCKVSHKAVSTTYVYSIR